MKLLNTYRLRARVLNDTEYHRISYVECNLLVGFTIQNNLVIDIGKLKIEAPSQEYISDEWWEKVNAIS